MFTDEDLKLAADILHRCRGRGMRVAVAESCTGGLIAGLITAIAGSSDIFDRGFVTYSNAAKDELLGVRAELLRTKGAQALAGRGQPRRHRHRRARRRVTGPPGRPRPHGHRPEGWPYPPLLRGLPRRSPRRSPRHRAPGDGAAARRARRLRPGRRLLRTAAQPPVSPAPGRGAAATHPHRTARTPDARRR